MQEPTLVSSTSDVGTHNRATSSSISRAEASASSAQPGSSNQTSNITNNVQNPKSPPINHTRNSSLDHRLSQRSVHSRNPSLDFRHTRNNSADLNKFFKNDVGLVFGSHQGNKNEYLNKNIK